MKTFKPMLAPNEPINLDEVKYPLMVSYKLDGIRCIFYKGQILSRSLKQIQNKQLREKFELLRKYSEDNNCILDGEIYSPSLTFQEIVSFVMTEDFTDTKTIKKYGECHIPKDLKFYCFDGINKDDVNQPFSERTLYNVLPLMYGYENIIEIVGQKSLFSKKVIELYFEQALENGYEGLILRDHNGRYKFGRGTIKEGLIYKLKPFLDFDAKILGVIQSTEVNEDAEKKINELGRSVTSKKLGERHTIEKASAFEVDYEGKPLKVVLAMTDEEKTEVWKNRNEYIGRWITYKGMLVGSKDVVRHPVMLRFRENKE